jgi:hypothetical protein
MAWVWNSWIDYGIPLGDDSDSILRRHRLRYIRFGGRLGLNEEEEEEERNIALAEGWSRGMLEIYHCRRCRSQARMGGLA